MEHFNKYRKPSFQLVADLEEIRIVIVNTKALETALDEVLVEGLGLVSTVIQGADILFRGKI